MTRSLALLTPLLLLTAPGLAQEKQKRTYPDGVVAIVEDGPVSRHELELACMLRSDYRRHPEGSDERQAIREFELEELIKQRILLKLVEGAEIEFSEDDQKRLEWELTRRATDRRGVEGLKEDLEAIGIPFRYFVSRQRSNILVFKLLTKSISRDIFITPDEIRRAYERDKTKAFMREGEVRLRQIVIYPNRSQAYRPEPKGIKAKLEAEDYDPKALIAELRQRIVGGEPFRRVAEQTSMGVHFAEEIVHSTETNLNDVFPWPIGKRAKALEVGAVSEVLESKSGSLHLLLVVYRRPKGPLPIDEVQARIEQGMKGRIWKARVDTFIREAREKAFVKKFAPYG